MLKYLHSNSTARWCDGKGGNLLCSVCGSLLSLCVALCLLISTSSNCQVTFVSWSIGSVRTLVVLYVTTSIRSMLLAPRGTLYEDSLRTYQDLTSAFCKLLKAEFPSTWNWPLPRAVTAGAVTPPRAPVNAWILPPEAAFPEACVAVVVAAAAAADEVVTEAAALVVVAASEEPEFEAPEPVPAITFPWSSTEATEAKLVVIPNTALNASAWAPVLAVWALAAAVAVAHVSLAVWSAPQLFVKVSQMNWVIIPMAWAEPWLYEAINRLDIFSETHWV